MTRHLWMLVLVALGGCVSSNSVQCADGRTCPEGTTCGTLVQGCVQPVQTTACEGLADGDRCSFPGTVDGTCVEGVCLDHVCGNGELEAGEACDDRNTDSGDGCSASCLSNEQCGNATIDVHVGEECDDGNLVGGDGCQSTCLVPRCGDGQIDSNRDEECDNGAGNSNAPDQACRTNCLARRCGDGTTDTGEVCDDGNFVAGDGCTPDCLSNEVCGNNIVDELAGETCDDGARTRTADGCDTTCTREVPVWRLWQGGRPTAREQHSIVYDGARGRLLLFGGVFGTAVSSETWEWDGTAWTRATGASPPARHSHAMAFDARRQRVVMFGGVFGGYLSDTWEWDGERWLQLFPATSPSARGGHAMAYDAARGRVVLFGGDGSGGKLGDTWEWNGTTWAAVATNAAMARSGAALAYDPVGRRTLLYGGQSGSAYLDDMWQWNGTQWTAVAVTTPPPRAEHGLVYDAVRTRIVLFGGTNGTSLGDLWEWNGTAWSPITTTLPSARAAHAMAYHLPTQRLVMTGGTAGASEYWEYDGATWSLTPSPSTGPLRRSGHGTAYQPHNGRTLMFGGAETHFGSSQTVVRGDTWEWLGASWVQRAPALSPSARWMHAMAYERHTGRVILFGGTTVPSTGSIPDKPGLAETWAWDGTTWTNVTPTGTSPPGRLSAQLAYDVARSRIVLYGGQANANSQTYLSDTWEWDGTAWIPLTPATSPGPRVVHDLVYDPERQRVVMFGGSSSTAPMTDYENDTWEWDGTNWTLVPTTSPPTGRRGHAMTYDAQRERIVSFGGFGYHWTNDLWELDASTWSPLYTAGSPAVRDRHSFDYDAVRSQTLTTGGGDFFETGETWIYRWKSGAPTETCMFGFDADGDGLRGCTDPDCWGRCTPYCPPNAPCNTTLPRCGDGVCNAALESCRLCPGDCGACPFVCGDFVCATGESNCPGDCD